ncbi:MAG: TPM domain-containing protein, partial [Eubacterium sp.]|nr:TPM domain-containing protein [Eubacterium sp.]
MVKIRYNKSLVRIASVLLTVIITIGLISYGTFSASVVYADDLVEYTNSDTGYKIIIEDDADLLTDDEESKLVTVMKSITKYGNAYYLAAYGQTGEDSDISDKRYNERFGDPGTVNGVVFLVNMDANSMYLSGNGEFPYWLEEGTAQKIISECVPVYNSEGNFACAEYIFNKYFDAIEASDRQFHYETVGEDVKSDNETESNSSESNSSEDNIRVKNTETGYESVIIDEADLISSGEEKALLEDMSPFTKYGNAVFYTINKNKGVTSEVATSKFWELYGQDSSGSIFIIDMINRQIYIYSDGEVYNTVTRAKAATVVDNVYRYASNKEYYKCAGEAFRELSTIMDGGKVAAPMKLVSNILLASIMGLIIAYWIVRAFSTVPKASEKELLAAIQAQQNLLNYRKVFTHQTRRYDPPSSSSSGGGG